jgi:hypothetical protein
MTPELKKTILDKAQRLADDNDSIAIYDLESILENMIDRDETVSELRQRATVEALEETDELTVSNISKMDTGIQIINLNTLKDEEI